MSWEAKGIIDQLLADPTLVQIRDQKIFAVIAPQKVDFPYQVVRLISSVPEKDKDGPATVDTVRIQVSNFSTNYTEAVQMARRSREILDDVQDQIISGVNFQYIAFENEEELLEKDLAVLQVETDYLCRVIN